MKQFFLAVTLLSFAISHGGSAFAQSVELTNPFSLNTFLQGWFQQNLEELGAGSDRINIPELKKKADSGDGKAQLNMGFVLLFGVAETPPDFELAANWVRRAAAQNSLEGKLLLGEMYAHGVGVSKDENKSVALSVSAASRGLPAAQFLMGMLYFSGKRGVEKNLETAVDWTRESAEQGYAEAQNTLAYFLDYGLGTKLDESLAALWYQRAADNGNLNALNELGVKFLFGIGVQQDEKKALEIFREAAAAGLISAHFNLGFVYQDGRGVERNYTQAMRFYETAAGYDFPKAYFAIANMHENGLGVEKNIATAVDWYDTAAALGYVRAHIAIGRLHEKGRGFPRNDKVAYMRYYIASLIDSTLGFEDWKFLATRMNAKDIAEAQKMARKWLHENPDPSEN